ncbi:sulfatase-like hydrolase/transferase, partial [Candidatus Bathyarchaeota archaeon]|nr:sulfatase-like hydrolase/transferase [Candidatus Bathyarchaeota archaeon]
MNSIKRVILITVDCLRADHVSCIGGGNITPNIDKLARDGVVFTRAFSNGPGTNQSFPAILTSTYFLMHGGMRLLPGYTTLAEVLRSHGFKTVGFHSNPFLSRILGWNQGFNEFYDFMNVLKSPSAAVTRSSLLAKAVKFLDKVIRMLNNKKIQTILRRFYYRWNEFEIPYVEGSELNRHVITWINENKEENFFLWMHYMDPHRPYMPPPPYLGDFATRKEAFMFDVMMDSKISQGKVSEEELNKLRRL